MLVVLLSLLLVSLRPETGCSAMLFQLCARLAALLLVLPSLVLSQDSTQKFQITAVVTDNSGAVVPGTTIQVQDISTAMKFSGTTNGIGNFTIPVEPRRYDVSISKLGFKTLTEQIEVKSGSDQRFSFVLMRDETRFEIWTCSPCLPIASDTRMSQLPVQSVLPDQLVLSPSPVVPPITQYRRHRNPIAHFFSAIGRRLGF
jgi:hypothetical protein